MKGREEFTRQKSRFSQFWTFTPDMAISVHCRSRRDLEIRDLGNFFHVFLGNSTITMVRFNAKSILNTNGSGSTKNCPVHENIVLTPYKPTQTELFMLEVGGSGSSEAILLEMVKCGKTYN